MDARAHRDLLLFGIAATGSFCVFVLPWYVPVTGAPLLSDSYMLGFANWVAVLALLATAAALFVTAGHLKVAPLDGPLWRAGRPSERRRAATVAVVLAGLSLLCTLALVWVTRGVPYGEARYFLDRGAQLAEGYRPLIDFGYSYSLGGLYGPVGLWRLFGSQGLSPLSAYIIVYVALSLCSYWMLYVVVSRFELRDVQRAWILACLGIITVLNVTLGIQYVPARYLAPAVALVALHAWFRSPRITGTRRALGGGLVAVGGLALTLVISSSEMAMAGCAATIAYLIVMLPADRRAALVAGALYVACLIPLAIGARGSLGLVASFAAGAYNFPVLPGPPALVYIVAVFAAAILVPRALTGGGARERPLTAGLVVLGAALVPAAFGRADIAHLFYNGLPVFILTAALLARSRPGLFAPFLLAVAMVFGVAQYVGVTQLARPQLLRAAAANLGLSDGAFALVQRVVTWPPTATQDVAREARAWPRTTADVSDLDRFHRVLAPLGLYPPDTEIAFDLARRHRLAADPFPGPGFTQDDLRTKLASLDRADCLLILLPYAPVVEGAKPDDTPSVGWALRPHEQRSFGALAMFPLGLYERNLQPNLDGLLIAHVKQHFRRAGTWGQYALYVPRESSP